MTIDEFCRFTCRFNGGCSTCPNWVEMLGQLWRARVQGGSSRPPEGHSCGGTWYSIAGSTCPQLQERQLGKGVEMLCGCVFVILSRQYCSNLYWLWWWLHIWAAALPWCLYQCVCVCVCGGGGGWLACVHCYNYTVVSDELLMMTTLIC